MRKAVRVILRTAAAGAVLFVASFAFLETKAGLSKIVDWGLYDVEPSCTFCDRLPDASALDLIAHAGGKIDGFTYTNSREALAASLEGGFRFIELDLRRTLDNRYFAAHRVKEFNAMTGYPENFEIPPTSSDVRERTIEGKFTPILLEDLVPVFEKHPERVLVTDKANRYRKLLDEFPLPDQLLVEVRNVDQYVAAKLAGVPNVAVDTADPDVVRRYGIELVVVSADLRSAQSVERHGREGAPFDLRKLQRHPRIRPGARVARVRGYVLHGPSRVRNRRTPSNLTASNGLSGIPRDDRGKGGCLRTATAFCLSDWFGRSSPLSYPRRIRAGEAPTRPFARRRAAPTDDSHAEDRAR